MKAIATPAALASALKGASIKGASWVLAPMNHHAMPLMVKEEPWIDPLSLVTLVLGLIRVDAQGSTGWSIDLRTPAMRAAILDLLAQAGLVIVHDLFQVVIGLGITPAMARSIPWLDVRILERASHLGLMSKGKDGSDGGRLDHLEAMLANHKVEGVPFVGAPGVINEGLIATCADRPLTMNMTHQALAMAVAVRQLAFKTFDSLPQDLQNHFLDNIMPAAVEHVLMTKIGVHLNPSACSSLDQAIPGILANREKRLAGVGLANPGSPSAVIAWLKEMDLLQHFGKTRSGPKIDDDTLKFLTSTIPALGWLREWRKFRTLSNKIWLRGGMRSADGRVHPNHAIMRAATGRSSTRDPEIAGVPKTCRPLVSPAPGNGIIELDYKSKEIGVAAAVFKCPALKAVYDKGDAISALAQIIFPEKLKSLELDVINKHHKDARKKSKTISYGVLYGRMAHSLARALKTSKLKAELLISQIFDAFPELEKGMLANVEYTRWHGKIPILRGLVRRLTRAEMAQSWKVETLARNTPIQGSAAVVFLLAIVLVARAIEPFGGNIIIPLHDSLVIEGPLGEAFTDEKEKTKYRNLVAIAKAAEQAMKQAFSTIFPGFDALVEINDESPHCWNKDGEADSLTQLLAETKIRTDDKGTSSQLSSKTTHSR